MPNREGDFDFDVKRHFRIEAGMNSPYGRVQHRVLTNYGCGHGWYQSGVGKEDFQLGATGSSIECLGHAIKRPRSAAQDPLYPAKWIKCKHGDIVLDADDGDIILKADNIILEAKGVRDDLSGDIQMTSTKAIHVKTEDLRVKTTTLDVVADKSSTISAKIQANLIGGICNVISRSDMGASLNLTLIEEIKKSLHTPDQDWDRTAPVVPGSMSVSSDAPNQEIGGSV